MNEPPFLTDAQLRALALKLRLSQRERQIVDGILRDRSEHEIAQELRISQSTVHTHIKRLYTKLRVHGRTSLIVRVFREYRDSQPPGE